MTFPKVVYQQSINWKLYKEPKISANIETQNYTPVTYVVKKIDFTEHKFGRIGI